jgi:hypothetical protein
MENNDILDYRKEGYPYGERPWKRPNPNTATSTIRRVSIYKAIINKKQNGGSKVFGKMQKIN